MRGTVLGAETIQRHGSRGRADHWELVTNHRHPLGIVALSDGFQEFKKVIVRKPSRMTR